MKKIVVTGATSFIGSHLIERLLLRGNYIYAIVRPNSCNFHRLKEHEKLNVIELDIDEYDQLDRYILEDIDVFYHLAWEGARAPFRNDRELQIKNFEASVCAIKSSLRLNAKLFIGAGSQAEYGKFNGKVDESFECNPIAEYGKYKLKTFNTLSEIAEQHKIRFIWTRIFSVFGEYDYQGTLVMSAIDKLLKGESIQLTECIQNWDFIYVGDVSELMVKLSENPPESGAYNVASGYARPLREFVEQLKSITKSSSQLEFGALSYGIEGPVSFEPVINKVKDAMGWEPKYSFEEGILNIISSKL